MFKHLVPLFLLSLLAPLHAQVPVSFEDAVAAYQRGEHESARLAFKRMAEAGMPEAQFNLGAMLVNGEGGPADLVDGGIWINLAAAEGHNSAQQAMQVLLAQLEVGQRSRLKAGTARRTEQSGWEVLTTRHRPEPYSDDCHEKDSAESPGTDAAMVEADADITTIDGRRVRMHRSQPRYPSNAGRHGLMGMVSLGAWVNAEGRLEQPHVISAFPERQFESEALRAFSNWTLEWLDEPPENLPRYLEQLIIFQINADTPWGQTIRELESTLREADQDLAAAHRAVWSIDQFDLQNLLTEPLAPAFIIATTYQAARAGITAAQHDLSRRFSSGSGVCTDSESAVFWLKQAAFEGDPEAQYRLSRNSSVDPDFQNDLRRSAISAGLLPAILTEIRRQVTNPEQADPEYLSGLIEQLPRRYRRNSDNAIVEQARQLATGESPTAE